MLRRLLFLMTAVALASQCRTTGRRGASVREAGEGSAGKRYTELKLVEEQYLVSAGPQVQDASNTKIDSLTLINYVKDGASAILLEATTTASGSEAANFLQYEVCQGSVCFIKGRTLLWNDVVGIPATIKVGSQNVALKGQVEVKARACLLPKRILRPQNRLDYNCGPEFVLQHSLAQNVAKGAAATYFVKYNDLKQELRALPVSLAPLAKDYVAWVKSNGGPQGRSEKHLYIFALNILEDPVFYGDLFATRLWGYTASLAMKGMEDQSKGLNLTGSALDNIPWGNPSQADSLISAQYPPPVYDQDSGKTVQRVPEITNELACLESNNAEGVSGKRYWDQEERACYEEQSLEDDGYVTVKYPAEISTPTSIAGLVLLSVSAVGIVAWGGYEVMSGQSTSFLTGRSLGINGDTMSAARFLAVADAKGAISEAPLRQTLAQKSVLRGKIESLIRQVSQDSGDVKWELRDGQVFAYREQLQGKSGVDGVQKSYLDARGMPAPEPVVLGKAVNPMGGVRPRIFGGTLASIAAVTVGAGLLAHGIVNYQKGRGLAENPKQKLLNAVKATEKKVLDLQKQINALEEKLLPSPA
ncbi:MAG: hypothetical protein OXT67_06535 [Zetaproteobacteria bacterium]|nr:hypothetical protein [Zetaproteobacteria bacterium]